MLAVFLVVEDPAKGGRVAYRYPPPRTELTTSSSSSSSSVADGVPAPFPNSPLATSSSPALHPLTLYDSEAMRTLDRLCADESPDTDGRIKKT